MVYSNIIFMEGPSILINRRRLVAITPGAFGLATLAGRNPAWAASPSPEQQTYFLFAFSNPVAGQEEAYARWFSESHVHDMELLSSVVAAQRCVDAGVELRKGPVKTPHDLVLYTVVTDRPGEVRDAIERRAGMGGAWPGPTLAAVRTVTYRATQPRMDGAGGEPADARDGEAATYLVLAFLDAAAGQDEAFNTWYDTIHEPELLANPGVASGQRAVLSEVQMGPSDIQSRYLMMTLTTRDLPAVFRKIVAGGPPSPALDRTRGYGFNYRVVTS